MKFSKLALLQLDTKLKEWNKPKLQAPPAKGWLSLIRTMLGMSTYRLAERMELSQGRVTQIEAAERRGAVTLNTLKQAADAMDCQLIYAIVPKTSLQDILKNQAMRVAQEEIEAVSHTMALEDQAIDPKEKEKQRQDLVEELLDGPVKKLWNTKS